MQINRLKNVHRKFKANYISRDTLEETLDEAIDTLRIFSKEFDKNRTQLREFEGDKIELIESFLFDATRNLKAQKYEEVIKSIKKGKQVREEMKVAIDSISKYNDAKQLLEKIKQSIDQKWLKELLTVRIFGGQIKKIAHAIKQNKYMQANSIAKYCMGDMNDLQSAEQTTNEAETEMIWRRFEALKKICADTSEWSRNCPGDQLSISIYIEKLLSYLQEEGRLKLVNRLLDDLERSLKDRIQFNDLINKPDLVNTIDTKELKAALKKGSWTGGSNYILLNEIKRFRNNLNITKEHYITS